MTNTRRLIAITAIIILTAIAGLTGIATDPQPVSAADPVTVTLVTNTSKTTSHNLSLDSFAISFRTGSNETGYVLQEVDLRLTELGGIDDFSADARKNVTATNAGDVVHTLTNPDPLPSGAGEATVTLTAPADAVLDKATTYWLVVNETEGMIRYAATSGSKSLK